MTNEIENEPSANTDPPYFRCPNCNSRLKYDGYCVKLCRRKEPCGFGSWHNPQHNLVINRIRLFIGR